MRRPAAALETTSGALDGTDSEYRSDGSGDVLFPALSGCGLCGQAVGISRCSGYRPDGNSVVRDRQPVGTAEVFLNDYVANTLYPRQMHVYETFEEPDTAEKTGAARQKPVPENKSRTPVLKKEEEQLFQEVMTEFLGG